MVLKRQLIIDRGHCFASGREPQAIDTTLYSAFGQRQVSTMYTGINQYHVVLEVLPEFQQNPVFAELDLRAIEQRTPWSRSRRSRTSARP